jgi:predicted ribosome quality control (RQC) complex YloA/Tae2 family protein
MKEITYFLNNDNETEFVTFYVGQNANENDNLIDSADENDLWFHCDALPSCHIISKIPDGLDIIINKNKKIKQQFLKKGCLLVKENTNALKNNNNKLNFIVCKITDIKKLKKPGQVQCNKIYKRISI